MTARAPLPDPARRSTPLRLLALALLGVLPWARPAAAQQDFSTVQIRITPVAGAVSMLEGSGGNIGVSAGPDGLLMVDDQFAPLAERIHAALDTLDGEGAGKPRFVLNTHWHGDHTGGNAIFGKDGTLIAHAAVRRRLAEGLRRPGRTTPPAPPEMLPVITYADALSVHFNGEEIRLLHLPHGHTDGDTIVWFTGSKVAHLGDDFFSGRFPFVDLDSGGDVEGLAANIERLLVELPADTQLIPGHGPLSTMDDLRTFQRMLAESIAAVRERLAAGQSEAEVIAAGLPEEWQSWSWNFVTTAGWLKTVHRSLTQPAPHGDAAHAPAPHGDDAPAPAPAAGDTRAPR